MFSFCENGSCRSSLAQKCTFMWHCQRVGDYRQNMCTIPFRPYQTNQHLFERRNLCRADLSSTTRVRGSRPSSKTFWSSRNQVFLTRFSRLSTPELSNPFVSNFVARSLGNLGTEFLPAESLVTLSATDLSFHSTEIPNLQLFLSEILRDVTPVNILCFTFVSTVLGIMAAYIVHEVKGHVESPSAGLVDNNQQSNPRSINSSTALRKHGETETDVWLNLSTPSPFFRSVCARCPSLSSSTTFQYVQKPLFKKPKFQRQCLPAPDGGTVALDWPLHLDMDGCKELENIMLLVCGTTEGSHEDGIGKFSQLVEQHGYFPIVFNPRGCGASPLTTPRVFSAADTDDVRLVVKFIANSRPWATILGIGWGLGANVLARYLGEEGSYTPLTAAVSIDNPFDLGSVTRPMPGSRWVEFDHSLSKGLVQILDSSKMLFQGEKRGFDVSGALAATCLRDFDRAISRAVHGYKTVEDFYMNTSSGAILEGVRIPLLCVQHLEDYTRTQASIPDRAFERNSYTMLLVSRPLDSRDDHPGAASEWTHAIALEWLTAVEISMLKGRHPQLSEFSPTIKLPRELSNVENQFSGKSLETMDKNVATTVPVTTSGTAYHKEVADMETNGSAASNLQKEESTGRSAIPSNASHEEGAKALDVSKEGQQAEPQLSGTAYHKEVFDMETNGSAVSNLQKEESTGRSAIPSNASHGEGAKALDSSEEGQRAEPQLSGGGLTEAEEGERGQVVQVAETVMNVLDVTMPGTLADAQKQQVLQAVGRGETLVTALEEAVPEDVRGKMSTAVSEVVHAQGPSQKMAGSQPPVPSLPAGAADSIQGKLGELTGKKVGPKSDVDISPKSGSGSSDDTEMSGNTAPSDDTTKDISPERSDKSSEKEKPTLKETKDIDKGTVATKGDENLVPSKEEHMPDPKDRTQQLETKNESGGGNKGLDDALSTSSPTLEDQTHDQGDQGKNKQEQPREPANGPVEERKETASGGTSELTSHNDNPADKIDVTKSGLGSPTSEGKDNAKDVKGQADSEAVNGSVTEKNAKMLKDAESKVEVTAPPSNDDLGTPQSDAPKASGATSSSQTQGPQMPQNDPISTEEHSPSTEVPTDTSNSPAPSSRESPKPEVSAEDSNSQPSSSQGSPSDAQPIEAANAPPSSPPAPAVPASENPPPQSPPAPLPSVGDALQALTGFDDSTEMAVTNVFGVVENVLDKIEESPSAEANISRKESAEAENTSNHSTTKQPKNLEQSANEPEDENRKDQGNKDKHSKEVALVPDNLHQGSHLQPLTERRQERKEFKETKSPVEGEGVDPENSSSFLTASSHGVKPRLSKNDRGYINNALGQQAEPVTDEVQENCPNPQPTLSESSSNSVRECPPPDTADHGFIAESATEKRLEVMAADNDAEGEETADSLASDQVAAHNPVRDLVMNALKLEVVRRMGGAGLEALGINLEKEVAKVASAVSEVVTTGTQGLDSDLGGKLDILKNNIVAALSSVLGSDSLLGRILPFGVLAGVVMAALGATYLAVSDDQEEHSAQLKRSSSQRVGLDSPNDSGEPDEESSEELGNARAGQGQDSAEHVKQKISSETGEEWNAVDGVNGSASTGSSDREQKSAEQTVEAELPHRGKLMGAMAAAMSTTAAVTTSTTEEVAGIFERTEGSVQKFVPEVVGKAISMVSAVVPKTEAGGLDYERLVAVLTEVGQKGGPFTLVGKVALLWGGLRGAMSLTDRLLSFLRIKERPLHERLLGFGGMSVLLWTPVLVPLLPTLLQQWATKSPSGIADTAAGIGLYGAVFILVTIWGRQVRDYDRPLVSYGLQLFSIAKLRLFTGGLAIGIGMVSGYYGINWVLGYAQFEWDAVVVTNPGFPGAQASTILTSWKVLMLITQSLTVAVSGALVEEVLFRAWLYEEIAVDLGYHWAVGLSALAFALVHWSPAEVAGLWFLAVSLSGARARTNGDLSFPIGIHAGIVTTFSVMNLEELVRYMPETPTWITGAYAENPLAGALGTGMAAALAIAMYPRQQERFPEEK